MIKQLNITVLADDRVSGRGLLAEQGFSCWVDTGDHQFLLDTGGGMVIHHNARLLNVPLHRAEAVILSHGHDDHTGGLYSVLRLNPELRIGVHPKAFVPRYIEEENRIVKNGFSSRFSLKSPHRLVLTESPTDFFPGVSATGTIPRAYNTDAANRNCYLDEAASVPDRFVDDQAVLIETLAGTVVLVGCCRSGLANIMEYVADLTGRRSIYAIIGGLHLEHAATDTMENVLDMLFEFNVQMLGMAHCTGAEAEAVLRTKFSRHSFGISVGSRIRI